ncbi:MAG: hypothetical protein WD772_01355 [Pseudohongiellaceae bacterium]
MNQSISVRLYLPVLLTLTTCLALPASAAEFENADSPSPWQWLEGRRDQVSRNVTALGSYLDNWLGGDIVGENVNETFLRVRFNQLIGTEGGYNSELKIGGRLDLPRTSERWKLIFESDVEELNTLNENRLENTSSDVSIGGFRYQHETRAGWDLSHDIGLRARLPADPFYRFRAVYGQQLSTNWSLGFSQKIWYYDSRGWGNDTAVSFDRKLDERQFFRIISEIDYKDDRNIVEFGQSVSLHRTLGNMETVSYELGVLGLNEPNVRISDYYIQARYRRAVYEDWLIMEVAPQLLVARDENWHPEPRLFFNIEVLFFDF